MRRLGSYLVEIGYWVSLVFLWAGAGAIFAILVGLLKFAQLEGFIRKLWGAGLIYAFASIYLLIGLHYIGLILRARAQRGWFVREGPSGQIRISPWAIRDLIGQVLRQEVGLQQFRVSLEHAQEGVKIRVSGGVTSGQEVAEVGERVQRLLKERVEERIGVPVVEVTFLTRSVISSTPTEGESGPPSTSPPPSPSSSSSDPGSSSSSSPPQPSARGGGQGESRAEGEPKGGGGTP